MIKIIDALVQSACQRVGVDQNGEKYGCGWRATKRADGWQVLGPLGLLTVSPGLIRVREIQQQKVADVAACLGEQAR
jgi:hypothetical protein